MGEARDDADALLSVEEVCAWFKVTKSWVYDEVEAGRLPYVRIGRQHLRFRRTELRQFIEAHSRRSLQRRPRSPNPAGGRLESLD
jgi:excisionase family DNA binding protein